MANHPHWHVTSSDYISHVEGKYLPVDREKMESLSKEMWKAYRQDKVVSISYFVCFVIILPTIFRTMDIENSVNDSLIGFLTSLDLWIQTGTLCVEDLL